MSPRPGPALCLACASSLPPKATDAKIFVTRCCSRPICPTCTSRIPRLARYDPCLACLRGVRALGAQGETSKNVDAAVRDADVFVLGDVEDDQEDAGSSPSAPPAADGQPDTPSQEAPTSASAGFSPAPYKYYIQPGDTLLGLALKFHVDGRHLCRLNGLPPSTLSTTPHLLHTRRVITLPPSARTADKPHVFTGDRDLPADEAAKRDQARAREVARSRFQTLTKEADWAVVRAYVALADDAEDELEYEAKLKEGGAVRPPNGAGSGLEVRAIGRYLDDEEWEAGEVRDGRGTRMPQFPFLGAHPGKSEGAEGTAPGSWWTRRKKWWD